MDLPFSFVKEAGILGESHMKVKSALEDWNQLLCRLLPATHCFRESMRQKLFEEEAMLGP